MSGSVAVVIVAMGIMPVSMIVFRSLFGEAEPAVAGAGELNRSGEEHETDQTGDIHGLADKVADAQTEKIVVTERGGPDCSPNEDGHESDEYDADPASFAENIAELGPIHATGPEDDPSEQGNPRKQEQADAEDDVLECQNQVRQCSEQVLHGFLKPMYDWDLRTECR